MLGWPKDALALGPQMMSVGLSFASVATAESDREVRNALIGLWNSARYWRELLDAAVGSAVEGEKENARLISELTAAEIRDWLSLLENVEEATMELSVKADKILREKRFEDHFREADMPFDVADLTNLLGNIYERTGRKAREVRLALILEVDRRAKAAGFEVVPDDVESFEDEFMNLPFADTMSWQETAHLGASPANARRILSAIQSMSAEMADVVAPDRTEAG